jgi:hypothetical protein
LHPPNTLTGDIGKRACFGALAAQSIGNTVGQSSANNPSLVSLRGKGCV